MSSKNIDESEVADCGASLTIYSFRDTVAQLEQLVPFPPTSTGEKGEAYGGDSASVRPNSVVEYESEIAPSCDVGAHVSDLLDRLAPGCDRIGAYAAEARAHGFYGERGRPSAPVMLWLRADTDPGQLEFEVTHNQLQLLVRLGAHLAVTATMTSGA
jgi:hypothetical protein